MRDERYRRPEDIERVIQELEEDDLEYSVLFDDIETDSDDLDYESERIEDSSHDSDSEIEMENLPERLDEIETNIEENFRFFIGKDGETLWANEPVANISKTKSKNIIKIFPGPKHNARQCKTEIECFLQIISMDMIEKIVFYTNIYIEWRKNANPNSRDRDFRLTDRKEIQAFFGALFLLAVKRGNRTNLCEFFTTNGTGFTILRANFSERRFRLLMRCIRFDDVRTRVDRIKLDKLAPVRDLLECFVRNSQQSYSPGEFTTVDEMLVAFRGRCGFIQYMDKKPAKYGIKIYALCDARTFYTYNLEIYCGKQDTGPFATTNKPFDIVNRLTGPIKKTNRNVTTDNWFSSYPLAENLLRNGLTFIGTLKKNKIEIPPEFITENRFLEPGKYQFGAQPNMTLVSMVTKKKKVVLVLSSMHDDNVVDEHTGKPNQIMDYNATKGGVDTVDLMCARCSTSRNTRRWPLVVFFRLLDLAAINALKIFKSNNPNSKIVRRIYVYNLALALMKDNLEYRATIQSLPREIKVFLEKYKPPQMTEPIVSSQSRACVLCGKKKNNRTSSTCCQCGNHVCKKHSSKTVQCESCIQPAREQDFEDV